MLKEGTNDNDHLIIYSNEGYNQVQLLAGNDFLDATSWSEYIDGGQGNDTILAHGGDDTVYAGDGDDTVRGYGGNDQLYGNAGNDTLEGGSGGDTLNGGDGQDWAIYHSSHWVFANMQDNGYLNEDRIGIDRLTSIENLSTGDGNDTLKGDGADNIFKSHGGNDLLEGNGGNDTLDGGSGGDTLDGGTGQDWAVYHSTDWVFANLAGNGYLNENGVGVDTLISIENIATGSGNDTLNGDGFDNIFKSHDGDDQLYGGGGNDSLEGGTGVNTLDGGEGQDTVIYHTDHDVSVDLTAIDYNGQIYRSYGNVGTFDKLINIENVETGRGNDSLKGNDFDNILKGHANKDTLFGSSGNDTLDGGGYNGDGMHHDNDTVNYESFTTSILVNTATGQVIKTGRGTDTLVAVEEIRTGSGNDTLIGSDSFVRLFAGAGNDTLVGGLGSYQMDGGEGYDLLDYTSYSSDIWIDLSDSGIDHYGKRHHTSVEDVRTGTGRDHLKGSDSIGETFLAGAGDDTMKGGGGNDFLDGEEGDDHLYGGTGADTLNGGNGNDVLEGGYGDNLFNGGSGNDTFKSNGDNETLDGGDGHDSVFFTALASEFFTPQFSINLATGQGFQDSGIYLNSNKTLISIEEVHAGPANDTLIGSSHADTLGGGAGNDTINGADGNDLLKGDAGTDSLNGADGNDVLEGGDGDDILDGGVGHDTAIYNSSWFTQTFVDLAKGQIVEKGIGTDTVISIEEVHTGKGNDDLKGSAAAEKLSGGEGNDYLGGRGGDDILQGGSGNDTLDGGDGHDKLTGGEGVDKFYFSLNGHTHLNDIITDFKTSDGDKIYVSQMGITSFINDAQFSSTNATGQLRFDAATHTLQGSTNADSTAEIHIHLLGVTSLSATDIIL